MKNLLQYFSWLTATLLLASLIIGLILSPLVLIWLVNSIFNTNTPYTFESWVASIFAIGLIKIGLGYFKKEGN